MTIEDVNGKANAGLTTGIIGTALSGLLTLGGGFYRRFLFLQKVTK